MAETVKRHQEGRRARAAGTPGRDRQQGACPEAKVECRHVLERWLNTYAAINVTVRTQQGYRGIIKRYILPKMGNVALQDLAARHIQAMYAEMLVKVSAGRSFIPIGFYGKHFPTVSGGGLSVVIQPTRLWRHDHRLSPNPPMDMGWTA